MKTKEVNALFNVEFKNFASLRTKNRIRENGPIFRMEKLGLIDGMEGTAILLHSERTDWFGWLPLAELTLQKL
jgi:hypothetical protein